MSETTAGVLVEEREDVHSVPAQHDNVWRAVKANDEIVKSKRDLDQIVSTISVLAVDEPELCQELLNVCLAQMGSEMEDNEDSFSDFHNAFVARVDRIVRSKNMDNLVKEKEASIDAETDEKKREERLQEFDEMKTNFRTRKIEIATFVGRLFLTHLIYSEDVLGYVTDLTKSLSREDGQFIVDEHSIECAVLLLSMVGKKLDGMLSAEDSIWSEEETEGRRSLLDAAFSSIAAAQPLVSEQIRIMIVDLVELRENGWVKTVDEGPKIETEEGESVPTEAVDEGPKKMDEIEGETEEDINQLEQVEETPYMSLLTEGLDEVETLNADEKDWQLHMLDEECIHLRKKLEDQTEKNSVLSRKSTNQAKEIHRLESDRERLKEESDELEKKCQELTDQVQAEEKESQLWYNYYLEVADKLKEREENDSILSQKSANQEIRRPEKDMRILTKKCDQLEKKCQELTDQLDAQKSETHEWYGNYKDVHKKWKDQEEKNSILSKKSANQTTEICRLEKDRSELQKELQRPKESEESTRLDTDLTGKITLLEEQCASMEQKWRASEEERKRMEDETIRVDEERKKVLTEVMEIRAELTKARDDKEAFRNDYRCYKQHYEAQVEQLKEADKELDQWKEKYKQLQSNHDSEKDRKIRMLDKKCNEMKKKLDDQSKKLSAETSMVSRLEDDKRKSTTILNKTDVVMFMLKKSHQAQVDHAKEKEKKIQMLNESKKKLEDQISVLSKKLAEETRFENASLRKELDKCKKLRQEWIVYAERKEKECIELNKKLDDQIKKNSDLSKKLADETSKFSLLEEEQRKSAVKLSATIAELDRFEKSYNEWVDFAERKEKEYIELNKKLDVQMKTNSDLSKKLADETSKVSRLKDEKSKLTTELDESDDAYQSWFDFGNRKEKECIELKKKFDEQMKKSLDLSRKLADETSMVNRLENEKRKLRAQLTETDIALSQWKMDDQSWFDYAKRKEKECIESKNKLDDQIVKNSDLSRKLAEKTSKMNRLKDDKALLTSELTETIKVFDQWKENHQKCNASDKKLTDDTSKATLEIWKKSHQTWVDHAKELEKKIDILKESEKKLTNQISDLTKKLTDETSKVTRLEVEKEKLKTEISETEVAYQSWVDYGNEKDEECIELEEKLKDLEEKNSVLSKKSVNHVSEIRRLENRRKEMKEKLERLDELEKKCQELTYQAGETWYSDYLEVIEKLKVQEEKNSTLSKKSDKHKAEISRLENSRNEMKEEMRVLNEKCIEKENILNIRMKMYPIWSEQSYDDGRVFYYNAYTKERVWEKPDELKTTAKPRKK